MSLRTNSNPGNFAGKCPALADGRLWIEIPARVAFTRKIGHTRTLFPDPPFWTRTYARATALFTHSGFSLLPHSAHAGRFRADGNRLVPGEERRSHHVHELHGVCAGHHRFLGGRASHSCAAAAGGSCHAAGSWGQLGELSFPRHDLFGVRIGGHWWGLIGGHGFFLASGGLDPAARDMMIAAFLCMMFYMSVAATIPTGAMAERWSFKSFSIFTCITGAFIFPIFGCWMWGGGWLAALGKNMQLGNGAVDYAGSSVVHLLGGSLALAGVLAIGPRIGKYDTEGTPRPIFGHNVPMLLLGTLLLAFAWFGFNTARSFAARDGQAARCREHRPGLGRRRIGRGALHVECLRQARSLPHVQRHAWRTGRQLPRLDAPTSTPGRPFSSATSPAASSQPGRRALPRTPRHRRPRRRYQRSRPQRPVGHARPGALLRQRHAFEARAPTVCDSPVPQASSTGAANRFLAQAHRASAASVLAGP